MAKKGYKSTKEAIDITKIFIQSSNISGIPNASNAESIADFIEALAKRLEPMVEEQN